MKKLIPFLLVTIALSACGKIDGKLKSGKRSTQFLSVNAQNLSPQEFATACQNQGGILEQSATICVYESFSKTLAAGYATSETTADYPLGDIAAGTAVLAIGSVSNNSVELVLNNARITSIPSASNRPVTTNGGSLAFRLRPGSFYGVKVYVYTCLNQAMQPVRCPY
jgi:hypothetical protein